MYTAAVVIAVSLTAYLVVIKKTRFQRFLLVVLLLMLVGVVLSNQTSEDDAIDQVDSHPTDEEGRLLE